MSDLIKINLQLFSEGGDGAGSGDSGTSQAAAGDVVTGAEGANGVQDTAAGNMQTDAQPERPSFKELIKGDYKDDFSRETQKIINQRFKHVKGLEEELNNSRAILDILGARYGLSANDYDGLSKALDADNAFYEEAAAERGIPVDAYKEMLRNSYENKQLHEMYAYEQERRLFNEKYAGWEREAESLKAIYPDFDFGEEFLNPDFAGLINNGVDVKTAYQAIHHDEIMSGAIAYTAQRVAKKTAEGIAAKGSRPLENGTSGQSSASSKVDVSKLTAEQMEALIERAARGEIIEL